MPPTTPPISAQPMQARKNFAVQPCHVSLIGMFRQVLLGNRRALLLSCGRECQQNSPDDADEDNIRKIPMNAVLPCLHSLDGHYRSMDQALACGEGNQGAVGGRLFGSQQQKGAERDEPTKKHRPAFVFLFEEPTSVLSRKFLANVREP